MAPPKNIKPVSNSKRKLVKGSAAAMPAILTLRSGAAFARSSSDACLEKDQQRAGREKPTWAVTREALDHRDPWARIESEYILVEEAKIELLNGNEESIVAIGNSFKIVWTDSGWKNLAPSSNDHHTFKYERRINSQEEVIIMTSNSLPNKLFKVVEGNPFNQGYNKPILVLAQVNGNGIRIGYGPSMADNHITGSCWASVNPLDSD